MKQKPTSHRFPKLLSELKAEVQNQGIQLPKKRDYRLVWPKVIGLLLWSLMALLFILWILNHK